MVINGAIVSDLDMMYIESVLQVSITHIMSNIFNLNCIVLNIYIDQIWM